MSNHLERLERLERFENAFETISSFPCPVPAGEPILRGDGRSDSVLAARMENNGKVIGRVMRFLHGDTFEAVLTGIRLDGDGNLVAEKIINNPKQLGHGSKVKPTIVSAPSEGQELAIEATLADIEQVLASSDDQQQAA